MKLNRKNASFLQEAIHSWNKSGLLTEPQAKTLSDDIEVVPFDWQRLAKYSMWASLICIIIAVSSVFLDKALLELLQKIFRAPNSVKCIALSIVATGLYFWGITRKLHNPEKMYSNEGILFLGVISTAGAIYELGHAVGTGNGVSMLLLLSFIIYGVLGFFFKSSLIWFFSLISLGSWLGAETGYLSGWGSYYLGMNYPIRFVIFGSALVGTTFALEQTVWFRYFFKSTLVIGLLYLFIALWIMSIFGNYGDLHSWQLAKQIELFHWSIIFGLVATLAIYHGLRFDNGITRGFGITFLFINLYTRYFEYFWSALPKSIFFAFLAITFWFVGTKAERIWNITKSKKPKP